MKNESKAFIYEDHVLFNKDKTTIISYRAKEANYAIPDSVTSIGKYAFANCNSITSINIPDSVNDIEYAAFGGCNSLTSINIPNSVTNIWDFAFADCDSLSSQVKSYIIQRFGDYVFYGDSVIYGEDL